MQTLHLAPCRIRTQITQEEGPLRSSSCCHWNHSSPERFAALVHLFFPSISVAARLYALFLPSGQAPRRALGRIKFKGHAKMPRDLRGAAPFCPRPFSSQQHEGRGLCSARGCRNTRGGKHPDVMLGEMPRILHQYRSSGHAKIPQRARSEQSRTATEICWGTKFFRSLKRLPLPRF